MSVTSSGRRADAEEIASRLRMNPEFAGKVYDTLTPGTTVIITDQTRRAEPPAPRSWRVEGLPPGGDPARAENTQSEKDRSLREPYASRSTGYGRAVAHS